MNRLDTLQKFYETLKKSDPESNQIKTVEEEIQKMLQEGSENDKSADTNKSSRLSSTSEEREPTITYESIEGVKSLIRSHNELRGTESLPNSSGGQLIPPRGLQRQSVSLHDLQEEVNGSSGEGEHHNGDDKTSNAGGSLRSASSGVISGGAVDSSQYSTHSKGSPILDNNHGATSKINKFKVVLCFYVRFILKVFLSLIIEE